MVGVVMLLICACGGDDVDGEVNVCQCGVSSDSCVKKVVWFFFRVVFAYFSSVGIQPIRGTGWRGNCGEESSSYAVSRCSSWLENPLAMAIENTRSVTSMVHLRLQGSSVMDYGVVTQRGVPAKKPKSNNFPTFFGGIFSQANKKLGPAKPHTNNNKNATTQQHTKEKQKRKNKQSQQFLLISFVRVPEHNP